MKIPRCILFSSVLNFMYERANFVATNQLGLFGNDTRESILKDVLKKNGVEVAGGKNSGYKQTLQLGRYKYKR